MWRPISRSHKMRDTGRTEGRSNLKVRAREIHRPFREVHKPQKSWRVCDEINWSNKEKHHNSARSQAISCKRTSLSRRVCKDCDPMPTRSLLDLSNIILRVAQLDQEGLPASIIPTKWAGAPVWKYTPLVGKRFDYISGAFSSRQNTIFQT